MMEKSRPLTFSRTGTVWLLILVAVVLILAAFALLPIKFAAPGWMTR